MTDDQPLVEVQGAPATSLESRHPRPNLWAIPDTLVICLTVPTVTAARYLDLSANTGSSWLFTFGLAALHLVIGFTSGPYAAGHSRTSVGEVFDLTRTLAVVGTVGFCIEVLSPTSRSPGPCRWSRQPGLSW